MKAGERELDEQVRVISLDTNVVGRKSALAMIAKMTDAAEGGYVCFSTVHMVMEAYDDPVYAARVNAADLVIPDGVPIVWMQKLLGHRKADRLRANDLMRSLLSYARENDLSVGFYGGAANVIERIERRAMDEFPGLNIAYAFSPPFGTLTADEDNMIIDEILAAAPDILFVGLGCPKQEIWMSDHRSRLNSVMLGVGASFDFYAGAVKECPRWLSRMGLEWLYRLRQQPKRLWKRYLIHNPRFMVLAARQLLFGVPDPRRQ